MGDDILADTQAHPRPGTRHPAAAVGAAAAAALDSAALPHPVAHLDAFADGELEEGGAELGAVGSIQERVDRRVAPSWMNRGFTDLIHKQFE